MSQRIRTFERFLSKDGRTYVPRVYAELDSERSWSAYIAFFGDTEPIITTDYLKTGATVGDVIDWADLLTIDDLHSALARAKTLNRASSLAAEVARLEFLERDALADAEALEDEADRDKAAAEVARDDAEAFRRERLETETDAAEWQEQLASVSAVEHEHAAQKARATAESTKAKKNASKMAAKRTRSKP